MNIEDKIDKVSEKISELERVDFSLQNDLNLMPKAVKAASKITMGKTPGTREANCLEELGKSYASFFEDDSEDEGTKNPEDSPGLLVRLMALKNYLKKEQSINSNILDKLDQKRELLRKELFNSHMESIGLKPIYDLTNKGESSRSATIQGGETPRSATIQGSESSRSATIQGGETPKLGTIERGESSRSATIERGESSRSFISESLDPRLKRVKVGTASDEKGKAPLVESDEKGKGKGPAPESPSSDDFYNPFDDIGID